MKQHKPLRFDLGRPMTEKQTEFYEKRGWSTDGVSRSMAWQTMDTWFTNRKKDRLREL